MAQIVKVTGYMIFPDDGAYEECNDIETFATVFKHRLKLRLQT